MKSLIKSSFFFLLLTTCMSIESTAQTGPEVCSIKYHYDIAGNRIKRECKCVNSWLPSDNLPWIDHSIFTSLFPNPTTGILTATFSEPIGGEAGNAIIIVRTLSGITVFQQEYSQILSSITIDISQQLPGQYLLSVAALNKLETYVVTKL